MVFDLFMGCFGNGITVCNKAVEINGDYLHVAHISEMGKITLYENKAHIPVDAWEKIEKTATCMRKRFLDEFNKRDDIDKYAILLDLMPLSTVAEYISDKEKSLHEKVSDLTEIFMDM